MPNFKDLYKADNLLLSPEPELLHLLSVKMREEADKSETQNKKTLILKKIPVYKAATAAAALIILIAGALLLPLALNGGQFLNTGFSDKNEMDLVAGAETFTAADGETEYFGTDGYYEENIGAADNAAESTYIFDDSETANSENYTVNDEAETEQQVFGTDTFAGEIVAEGEDNIAINPFGRKASINSSTDGGGSEIMAQTEAQAAAIAELPEAETTVAETTPAEKIKTMTTTAAAAVQEEKASLDNGSAATAGNSGSTYNQISGFANWPAKEYWKSYAVSGKTPEFIITENNNVKNEPEEEYEQDYEEEAAESDEGETVPESGAGGIVSDETGAEANEDVKEEAEDEKTEIETEDDYDESEEAAGNSLPGNSLLYIPYFNSFENFSMFFLSSPHTAVSVKFSTGAGLFAQKDLKGKNTMPFYSMLSSCLDKKISIGTAGGYYVCFTVKSGVREIYFKINNNDVMEISVSDYSGKYIVTVDKGTFVKLWNLADSY